MQGIIFDIKRFAVHDGPGIRQTVFFKGCPLTCWWCHNPESRARKIQYCQRERKIGQKSIAQTEQVGREISASLLLAEIEKDVPYFDESGGGVTFSGGEPLLQNHFLLEMLKLCRQHDIRTAVDTTGYAPEKIFEQVLENTDLFLFDLKILDNQAHKKYTGVQNSLILKNFQRLCALGVAQIVRIPLIPTVNMSEKAISELIGYLEPKLPATQNVDLLPYHKIAGHKYERMQIENRMGNTPEPLTENVEKIKKRFEKHGFSVKIGG